VRISVQVSTEASIENRSRFTVEVLQAMVDAVGASRVSVRLSPFPFFLGMGMADPVPQYTDLLHKAAAMYLSHLNLIESRVTGNDDVVSTEKLDLAYKLWIHARIIVAGGYDGDKARHLVDHEYPNREVAVAFDRGFIANPDLAFRLMHDIQLNEYD
jgi:NADPH2 dehydrogenase